MNEEKEMKEGQPTREPRYNGEVWGGYISGGVIEVTTMPPSGTDEEVTFLHWMGPTEMQEYLRKYKENDGEHWVQRNGYFQGPMADVTND